MGGRGRWPGDGQGRRGGWPGDVGGCLATPPRPRAGNLGGINCDQGQNPHPDGVDLLQLAHVLQFLHPRPRSRAAPIVCGALGAAASCAHLYPAHEREGPGLCGPQWRSGQSWGPAVFRETLPIPTGLGDPGASQPWQAGCPQGERVGLAPRAAEERLADPGVTSRRGLGGQGLCRPPHSSPSAPRGSWEGAWQVVDRRGEERLPATRGAKAGLQGASGGAAVSPQLLNTAIQHEATSEKSRFQQEPEFHAEAELERFGKKGRPRRGAHGD